MHAWEKKREPTSNINGHTQRCPRLVSFPLLQPLTHFLSGSVDCWAPTTLLGWQCGLFGLEKEVLTQTEGPHVSELSADSSGEGKPYLMTHKFKFSKALCGSGCYKFCYLLMGFEPETPTCCFEIFLHLFISAELIYLFRTRELA